MTISNLMTMAESSRKWVKNTAGKGEIAHYEQFLLFPQCFQKTCTGDTYKPGHVSERVNSLPNNPDFYQSHENIAGKGKNAGYHHFLLFPQFFFSPFTKQISNFHSHLSSAHAFNLDQFKNISFGKGLTHYHIVIHSLPNNPWFSLHRKRGF